MYLVQGKNLKDNELAIIITCDGCIDWIANWIPKNFIWHVFLNVNDYTNVGEEFCTNTQLQ